MTTPNTDDTSREELKRSILKLQTESGDYVVSALGINDPSRMYALLDFIDQYTKTMCERAVNAGRIEELEKLITLNKTLYGVEAEMTRRANNRLAQLSNPTQEKGKL